MGLYYKVILGLYRGYIIRLYWGYIGVILGLYYKVMGIGDDNGKENGNYYLDTRIAHSRHGNLV